MADPVLLPRFDARRGRWVGGDNRTLYAFTDARTGRVSVRPGGDIGLKSIGPCVSVRVATREEATREWQNPLHAGWKVEG